MQVVEETQGEPEKIKIDVVEEFLSTRYDFQRNIITGSVEFRPKSTGKYIPMTDEHINSLWRLLQKHKINYPVGILHTILNSSFAPAFDPFNNYFTNLPAWDGQTDHIQVLANSVTTHNQDLWNLCLRRWLIALVGCVLNPKIVNHQVLVFSGAQGVGKTTWFLKLVPEQLQEYYFSGMVNPDNKDTLTFLADCMIINMDELETLNRGQIGSLKELITKGTIKVRKPFRKNPEMLNRRASFVGSVNTDKFLNDPTGSRRFLCFDVSQIARETGVHIDQIFSQALALFNAGEKHYFDDDENAMIQANNQQFEQTFIEEEWLASTVRHCDPETEQCEYLSATEIAKAVEVKIGRKLIEKNVNNIGKAMTKQQHKTTKKDGSKKYVVKRITDLDDLLRNNLPGATA